MIEITYDKVVHTSDHFDKIHAYTERLIKQGDMYMDNTDGETVSLLALREVLEPNQVTARSRNNGGPKYPRRTEMLRSSRTWHDSRT